LPPCATSAASQPAFRASGRQDAGWLAAFAAPARYFASLAALLVVSASGTSF